MKSENKNFLYNVLYQIFIYIFPLVTIPYVSRVLGVDNIGIYSYTYSIVSCLMLFSMLGINNYGNREISKVRDDKEKLSKLFFSIYQLQLICSTLIFLMYIVFLLLCNNEYKIIFCVQAINLFSVFFDINWFYFGLEKFKITIRRNVIIKILSTVLVFIFVKSKSDLIIYTVIMSISTLLSQLYLLFNLPKFIAFRRVKLIESLQHLKSCLILFIPVLAYSIYRIMDKTMLGYLSTVSELGYYENAEKIINIPIAVITALGTVMLPRMSYIIEKGKEKNKIGETIYSSMKLALMLAINMTLGIVLIANDAALVLFGNEFEKSGLIMQLLSCTVFISSWASVIRTQYLIPNSKDKIYVLSTIGGAIINLILNIVFIPGLGAVGACIGTIAAESFLCISQSFFCRKELQIRKYIRVFLKEFIKAIFIFTISFACTLKIKNMYFRFGTQIIIYIVVFLIFNYKYILYDFLGKGSGKRVNQKG